MMARAMLPNPAKISKASRVVLDSFAAPARRRVKARMWAVPFFFAAVAFLQCFSAFPVRETAPLDPHFNATATPLYGVNNTVHMPLMFNVPRQSVWLYVPSSVVQAGLVEESEGEFNITEVQCADNYHGWRDD